MAIDKTKLGTVIRYKDFFSIEEIEKDVNLKKTSVINIETREYKDRPDRYFYRIWYWW